MTDEAMERSYERVGSLLAVAALKFASLPETFPVFQQWLIEDFKKDDSGVVEDWKAMQREYVEWYCKRYAEKALDIWQIT